MKDRLLHLLSKLNLSATKLADEINVQRSGISHILSGRNQPSFDFLVKILTKFPQIDPDWLILGQGNIFRKPDTNEQPPLRSEEAVQYGRSNQKKNLFHQNDNTNVTQTFFEKPDKNITDVTYVTRIILLYSDGGYEIFNQPKKG